MKALDGLPMPLNVGLTRREVMRGAAAAGASMSLMSLLAACGSSGSSGNKDLVKWALSGTVASVDTLTLGDNTIKPVLFSVLEGLMKVDPNGKLQPHLAEKWEQPDPLTNVYTLRKGVKFSDGTPLTVDDVVYSFQRQLDPKIASPNAYVLGTITSCEATGDNQVTIKQSAPSAQANFAAASVAGLIVSKAFAEKQGKKLGTPNGLNIGTGPYAIDSFTSGKQIVLTRNEKYWGDKPPVSRQELQMFADDQSRQVAMRTGTVEASIQFPLAQAKQWEGIKDVKAEYVPFHRMQYLSFDLTQPPWNDINVRRAVGYAVDRAGIVKSVLSGHGQVFKVISAPLQWEALVPGQVDQVLADVPPYEYDPEKAKAEIAKSPQFAKGFKAPMIADQTITLTAQVVAENLREIGIEIQIDDLPTNDFYARLLPHKNLGLAMIVFGADYPDPDNFMTALADSANAKPNYYNTAHYKNPKVDKLFEQEAALGGEVSKDPTSVNKQRADLLAQAAVMLGNDLPYLPLAFENASIATKSPVSYADFNGWYTFQPVFAATRT